MIKKLVVFSMAAIMAIAALTGCGSDSNDTPAVVTPPPPVETTKAVAVTGAGSVVDSTLKTTYTFATGTYTYTIDGFAAGDVLKFPAGSEAASVRNDSNYDGKVEITSGNAATGATITVVLTGLGTNDSKFYSVNSINSFLGANTIM